MTPSEYIKDQAADRRELLEKIHASIIQHDNTISAAVEPMMGKEMILYKSRGLMKYGLSSVKNYMSLHVLPMYAHKPLYEKYQSILTKAAFQKGCINFRSADEMPVDIVGHLITDCAKIDLVKIREDYLQAKKKAKKK